MGNHPNSRLIWDNNINYLFIYLPSSSSKHPYVNTYPTKITLINQWEGKCRIANLVKGTLITLVTELMGNQSHGGVSSYPKNRSGRDTHVANILPIITYTQINRTGPG